jgi:hypothetical protein
MMSRSSCKVYETGYPYFMTSSFIEGIPIFAESRFSKDRI